MTIRAYQGQQPTIDPSVYLDPQALVIGQVSIAAGASLWPNVVARGDVQRIEIGPRTNVQDNCVLHVSHDSAYCPGGRPLILGADITVGHQVTLHACTVADRCLIGIGSIVLDGAVLEADTLLGAGSLVPPGKVLEGGYLWHGSPVRQVRPLTPEELAFIRYSASHYVRLAQTHQAAG